MIKTKIYVGMDEFSHDWIGQSSIKSMVSVLTSKYIYAFKQLSVDAEVSLTIDSDDPIKATDKDIDFTIRAINKEAEDLIWHTIIKVANNI